MNVQDKIRNDITNRILECLERGVKPWVRPWDADSGSGMPTNLVSKKAYRGVNIPLLAIHQMVHGLQSSVYATYNQWAAAGCRVKKRPEHLKQGEGWGAQIMYYGNFEKEDETSDGESRVRRIPFIRTFTVFASDQVDGYEPPKAPKVKGRKPPKPWQRAEKVVKATGATIITKGDRAFYSPSSDTVTMPAIGRFHTREGYYGTLLHELTHWTGHKSRLDRLEAGARFGNQAYAFEELVAEMGGCFLMGATGLPVMEVIDGHASYIGNWIQILKKDNNAVIRAASLASKASDFVLGVKYENANA